MAPEEKHALEQALVGYKEKVDTTTRISLAWDKELIFVGRTPQGLEIEFDAQAQWGCKPTDALLLSLAACMGIDVVMFLQKMRIPLAAFRMDVVGERNPAPPQYFRTIELVLHIAGQDLSAQKIERAIALSHSKYCSVYNSLRQDMDIKVRYVLEERASVQ